MSVKFKVSTTYIMSRISNIINMSNTKSMSTANLNCQLYTKSPLSTMSRTSDMSTMRSISTVSKSTLSALSITSYTTNVFGVSSMSITPKTSNMSTMKSISKSTLSAVSVRSSLHGGDEDDEKYAKTIELEIDGKTRTFNTTMLRDRCFCEICFNRDTMQRAVLFNELAPEGFVPKKVEMMNDEVCIEWGDGHRSTIKFQDILEDMDSPKRVVWNNRLLSSAGVPSTPRVSLTTVEGVFKLALDLHLYGVAMATDVPPNVEATVEVAERLSAVQDTFYGRQWTFGTEEKDDMNTAEFADTAYSNIRLRPHTDGCYFACPPAIQVFHCLKNDCQGGDTQLVDGYHVVERLKIEHPLDYRVLSSYDVEHRYLDADRHLSFAGKIIQTDPDNRTSHPLLVRYNPYDRADLSEQADIGRGEKLGRHASKFTRFYTAYSRLAGLVNDPENSYWLRLNPGQVLFIDNWRVMHGRSAFKGARRMCGCYLQRDDWLSKLRMGGA